MVLLFFQSTNISFGFLLPNERGVSLFVTDKEKCFDTAVSTIFWHAPKYGKNAPTQRGSGSFGRSLLLKGKFWLEQLHLFLSTELSKFDTATNRLSAALTPLIHPSRRGGLLPPFGLVLTISSVSWNEFGVENIVVLTASQFQLFAAICKVALCDFAA